MARSLDRDITIHIPATPTSPPEPPISLTPPPPLAPPAVLVAHIPIPPFPAELDHTFTPDPQTRRVKPDPTLALLDDEDDKEDEDPGIPFFRNDPDAPTFFPLLVGEAGYRCVLGQKVYLVEFINDAWYLVERHFDTELGQHIHCTRSSLAVERENPLGLGWWLPDDEANPERLPTPIAPVPVEEEPLEYIEDDVVLNPQPTDPVEELTEAFRRLTPIHTKPPSPTFIPVAPQSIPMAAAPLTGALKGTPPTLFAGNRSESEQFLREFRLHCKLNKDHAIMKKPYSHVIYALGLIRGPTVNNWIDLEEQKLDGLTTCHPNPVADTDEQLWTQFETSFKNAWTDTLSKQNAYQKLTTLQMKGDDVNAYIAQFEYLANTAGWHRDASGTVEFFCRGLTESLLRACILRTTLAETMTEWQDAAHAEAQRARTLASCLLARGIKTSRRSDPTLLTTNVTIPPPVSASQDVVPMEIDALSTMARRQYRSNLSDAAYAQCQREGKCFNCLQTGHMAKECPKMRSSSQRINEISIEHSINNPTTQMVLRDALTLDPAAHSQIINSLMMIGDDELDMEALQINNLAIKSPGPFATLHSMSPTSSILSSKHTPLSSPPMSPCHSYRSGTGSPSFDPLTSTFLDTLSLNDEFPHVSGLFRPFLVSPVQFNDNNADNSDIWYDAEEGTDDLWPPPVPPVDVEDDTRFRRGVQTSFTSVSHSLDSPHHSTIQSPIPRYPSLFPRHAFERPLDPDMVQPAEVAMQQQDEGRRRKVTKKPSICLLHTRIQKKQKLREESENEEPRKQP
ncbi:hypothetical protein EDB92DRAFT_1947048 [Lactarius akahatsu]|uniref:CCHC-type domain-containing protein n=1 Tax=Lactarius akahatsu TaxID=416441 RepID=A0AAD4LFN7_9AGAM|nr:hypothetical protein EDB92DRAFT_1947048 [Lactarius akahatsu]